MPEVLCGVVTRERFEQGSLYTGFVVGVITATFLLIASFAEIQKRASSREMLERYQVLYTLMGVALTFLIAVKFSECSPQVFSFFLKRCGHQQQAENAAERFQAAIV